MCLSLFPSCPLAPSLALTGPATTPPTPPAVTENGIPAPGGLLGPAAHPGGHAALLLPLRRPARAAAGLPDRGEDTPAAGTHPHPDPCSQLPHAAAAPGCGGIWEGPTDARPCPLQLTFITGEKMTEIFIYSLELGHSAATRAIKASGG